MSQGGEFWEAAEEAKMNPGSDGFLHGFEREAFTTVALWGFRDPPFSPRLDLEE